MPVGMVLEFVFDGDDQDGLPVIDLGGLQPLAARAAALALNGGIEPALKRVRASVRLVTICDAPIAINRMEACVARRVNALPCTMICAGMPVEPRADGAERCFDMIHCQPFRAHVLSSSTLMPQRLS